MIKVKRIPNSKAKVSETLPKVGRPSDEEKTKFDKDEKEYIRYRGKGINIAEAAEKTGIASEKACRLEQNPNVQAQIKELERMKELTWIQKEELLYEKALDKALEMITDDKATMKDIRWWVERFEDKRGMSPEKVDGRIKGAKKPPKEHPLKKDDKANIFEEQEVEE
jgi:hypothetical protein